MQFSRDYHMLRNCYIRYDMDSHSTLGTSRLLATEEEWARSAKLYYFHPGVHVCSSLLLGSDVLARDSITPLICLTLEFIVRQKVVI